MPARKLDQELEDGVRNLLETTTLSYRDISTMLGVSMGTVAYIKKDRKIKRPSTNRVKSEVEKPDPTNERILQLESQVLTLKDERSRLKKAYEAAQRDNSIFEEIAVELRGIITPISPLPKAPRFQDSKSRIKESLGLFISDIHGDQIVLPHQVGGLERYDFNIALRRAEVLVDTTIKFTQNTLCNYSFETLYIFLGGDFTSGEIHDAVKNSYYRNSFRNSLAIAQMTALMIRDLAPYFDNVKVICVPGNHGRRTPKKDYENPRNNFDYLIYEVAYAYSRDLVNVEYLIPDAFSAAVDIEGHGFLVFHGDDIKGYQGIPWYGIERKTRRLAALSSVTDKSIDYYLMGHFHTQSAQSHLLGETVVNGSWIGTSPFPYNSMSVYNEPTQLLFGVHSKNGITWRLPVRLKSDDEHLGPHRYSVIMAK